MQTDPTEETQTALHMESACFAYTVSRPVLKNLSLSVAGPKLYGLAGPNGAGKSTLLHLMTGYLKPASGRVLLNGQDVSSLTRREVASKIALVPQAIQAAFTFRVLEIVLMGRHPFSGLRVFDSDQDVAIAAAALHTCGLAGFENRRVAELSGGEQRLVLIARALAQQTPMLLLDEPLAALDLGHQWQIMNLLRQLCSEGKTVLGTFHDLNAAARWCDHLFLLHEGKIAAEGSPSATLTSELLERLYAIPLSVTSDNFGRPHVDFPQIS